MRTEIEDGLDPQTPAHFKKAFPKLSSYASVEFCFFTLRMKAGAEVLQEGAQG
jgi:hypothetical protein